MSQKTNLRGTHTRALALIVLLALLVASGYANYRSSEVKAASGSNLPVVRIVSDAPVSTPSANALTTPAQDAAQTFADIAAQRDEQRAQELTMLEEIIADSNSDASILSQAQTQKLALIERTERENTLEALLKSACGFAQCIVYANGSSVTVVVESEELSSAQLTQMLDLIASETGLSAENIKILPRK